jgi:hypothetical protein
VGRPATGFFTTSKEDPLKRYIRKKLQPFRTKSPVKIPLKKRPPFLKRHSLWLTLSGSLIVGATFVSREALLEPFKDDVETMQQAIGFYFPKEESREWRSQVIDNRDKCGKALSHPESISLKTYPPVWGCTHDPWEIYKQESRFDEQTTNILDSIQKLASTERQPIDKENADPDVSTDQKGWELASAKVSKDEESIGILLMFEGSLSPKVKVRWKKQQFTILSHDLEVIRLVENGYGKDVNARRERALQLAGQQKAVAERYYRRSKFILFSVFAVGWTINLIGVFYGVEVKFEPE